MDGIYNKIRIVKGTNGMVFFLELALKNTLITIKNYYNLVRKGGAM